MIIKEESLKCISALNKLTSDDYYEKWHKIKSYYLDNKFIEYAVTKDGLYTGHGYEHCKSIYQILGLIIPDGTLSSEPIKRSYINAEELFVLDVSVLLHDIIMSINPANRRIHSLDAKNYIIEQVYKFQESILSSYLTRAQATAVSYVIYAHSDIKDENEKTIVKTFDEVCGYKDEISGELEKDINYKALSGLLRIADELDTNSNRTKWAARFKEQIPEESTVHWLKNSLFSLPRFNKSNPTELWLNVDKNAFIHEEGTQEQKIELILKVENKIQGELDNVNTILQFDSNFSLFNFKIRTVKAFCYDDKILEQIEKKKENYEIEGNRPIIQIVSQDFSIELEKAVYDLELIESGHFYLNKDKHAKDWIDTISLLENHEWLKQIISRFEEYLNQTKSTDKLYIIGIGFPGVLLSSALGNKMGFPFSYLIPKNEHELHVEMEKRIENVPELPIVLITDVVVFGSTLNDLIESLKQKDNLDCSRIVNYLTVFYRYPYNDYESIQLDSLDGLVALNAKIDIEICKKSAHNCNLKNKSLINLRFEPQI